MCARPLRPARPGAPRSRPGRRRRETTRAVGTAVTPAVTPLQLNTPFRTGGTMPTAHIADLVTRFYKTLHNDHDLTPFDHAVDADVIAHWSGLPELHGIAELRAAV